MKLTKMALPVVAVFILLGGAARAETRYPIVLAHGILATHGMAAMKRLAGGLRDAGHAVYVSEVSAIGAVELRAEQLARRIDDVLKLSGAVKINLVAHSMGGLDSRFLISRLGYAPKVASLTTLSTPHRGSPVADHLFNQAADGYYGGLIKFINTIAPLFNQATAWYESDILEGLFDLTTEQARVFNREVVDSPAVYYQSYAASAWHANEARGIHRLLRKGHALIYSVDGPNDGMVSINSARWGNFRGTVEADHFTVAGYGRPKVTPMQIKPFIQGVAQGLAERGF